MKNTIATPPAVATKKTSTKPAKAAPAKKTRAKPAVAPDRSLRELVALLQEITPKLGQVTLDAEIPGLGKHLSAARYRLKKVASLLNV